MKKLSWTKSFFLLLLILLQGCAGSRRDDPEVLARSQRVQITLGVIANALQFYHTDHGFFPEGLATLRETNYLAILPDLEREWNFNYYVDGDQVTQIEAVSTAVMLDGAGFKVIFRVFENKWEGYGIDKFP